VRAQLDGRGTRVERHPAGYVDRSRAPRTQTRPSTIAEGPTEAQRRSFTLVPKSASSRRVAWEAVMVSGQLGEEPDQLTRKPQSGGWIQVGCRSRG